MTGAQVGPRLSAVVASFRGVALVEECIRSFDRAIERLPAPLTVVLARTGDGADVRHLLEGRPWLRVVAADDAKSIPQLRGLGMLACAPGWIAVTEDHCLVDPDWLRILASRTVEGIDVLGGGMGNARAGVVNWGAYFAEYGFFSSARPRAEGAVLITGANVMYGPTLSGAVARWARDGLWEDVIHRRLSDEGARLVFEPDARVEQNGTYRFSSFCRDRFEHGRDYARVRLREQGAGRILRLLSTPLLPPLLLHRVRLAAAGEDPRMFLRSAPLTLAYLTAWAFGEAVGYALGPSEAVESSTST